MEDNTEKKLIVEERKEALSHLTSVQSQIYKLKLQYNQMKSSIIKEQFKYFMCSGLDSIENEVGDAPIIDNLPTNEEVKTVQQTVCELKEKLDTAKSEKEDSCDELEIAYDEFKANLKTLREVTENYQSEKQKLADTLEVATASLEENFGEESSDIQEKLQAMKDLNREVNVKLDEVEHNLLALRNMFVEGNELLEKISSDINYLRGSDRLSEWCGSMLSIKAGISGMMDRGLSGGVWHVSIDGPGTASDDSGSAGSDLQLNIKMILRWRDNDIYLESVDIDNPDLEAASVIERALAENDIRYLLVQLQYLWLHNYPIVGEIDKLRKKYAIDWEQESLTLTVMYGRTASIMCVLRTSPGYPANGSVSLENVKCDENYQLEELLLKKKSATLTEWLEHLQTKLDPGGSRNLESPQR